MTAPIDDSTTPPDTHSQAFRMYGKMLTFNRIKLETNDLDEIEKQLASTLSNRTSQIPVVIESNIEIDLAKVVELFWQWGLQPIGIITGILDDMAKELRLAIFPSDGKRIERIRPKKVKQDIATSSQDTENQVLSPQTNDSGTTLNHQVQDSFPDELNDCEGMSSMIYDQMLRSGQSINHVGGDLILTNSVNNGAEVITDNSLHIYGRAQGRLVAGATGDKEARIFCQRFNPSLVSVAGTYCLHDNIPEEVIDKPVQVRFVEGEGLVFEIMNNV